MDELSALPPDVSYASKRQSRVRASSLNPRYAYTNPSISPATTRAESPQYSSRFQNGISNAAYYDPSSHTHPDRPTIIAPTPRRHLIETSESQHWLNTPPLSPTSSRGLSPHLSTFPFNTVPRSSSTSSTTRKAGTHHRSFSALFQHENQRQRDAVGSPGLLRTALLRAGMDNEMAMGRRWIRWMHKGGMREWVLPTLIAFAVLVRICLGLGPYSGHGSPPMYGDYEAQRHWMEITTHLPFRQWYTYDLPYWGLDYPPLTAYVSWACGIIGTWIEPSWFALDTSRGIEALEAKVYMRLTVVALDILIYVPAMIMFSRTWQGTRSTRTQELVLLTLLLQPALLLIDHGHFQYNSVMLGLTVLSMNFFATGQDLLGAVCFVLSLGFKQMALYYAPAIGSYLLAKCLYLGFVDGSRLFIHLAITTVISFVLLFLPFLPPFASFSDILNPITRIFPFSRGLFEDKVANFWCASHVVIKWQSLASPELLVKLSTLLTAFGFLPSVTVMLRAGWRMRIEKEKDSHSAAASNSPDAPNNPQQIFIVTNDKAPTPFLPLLPYALLTSSISFFLFSFQVHEKSILLPLMPITLLLSGAHIDSSVYSWGAMVNNVAVFSMWPLLKRDGQAIPYIATLLLWNRAIGYNPFKIPPKTFVQFLSLAVHTVAIVLHILEFFITPPARLPHLFPVLNVLVSTPIFMLTWLWSIKSGLEVAWALGGLGPSSSRDSQKTQEVHPDRRASESDGLRAKSVGSTSGVNGVGGAFAGEAAFRQKGGRAVSLGFAQARRRVGGEVVAGKPDGHRSRESSVISEERR